MTVIAFMLIIATLALFARVWVPWGERPAGQLVRRQPLTLLGRLRMHGPPAALLWIATILALAVGWVGPLTLLVVTCLLAILIALPMHYTLTTQGIRAGWTPFRHWIEFGGVARRRGGVRLQGVAGARPLTVWLSGGRDDDDFVLLLRRLVRGSYTGQLGPEADLRSAPGATPSIIGIAGAGGS